MIRKPNFIGLSYESVEREHWAEDDHRWGTKDTTRFGFWLLALGGRLRDVVWPARRRAMLEGMPLRNVWPAGLSVSALDRARVRVEEWIAHNWMLALILAAFAGAAVNGAMR